MKTFDLEAAKRGAAVCTRDGRNARIIAFDCKGYVRKPILALIDMGDWEQSASWTKPAQTPKTCLKGNKKRQSRKITPYAHNVKVVINSGKQWVSRKKNAEAASGTIPRFI